MYIRKSRIFLRTTITFSGNFELLYGKFLDFISGIVFSFRELPLTHYIRLSPQVTHTPPPFTFNVELMFCLLKFSDN